MLHHIAKAARAFGCLRKPIFQNTKLSLATKHSVYCAAVLTVWLYGAETWNIKAEYMKCLNTLYNRCVRTILRVTRYIPAVHGESTFHSSNKLLLLEWRSQWATSVWTIVFAGLAIWVAWNQGKRQSSYHLVNWRRGGLVMAQGRNGGSQ